MEGGGWRMEGGGLMMEGGGRRVENGGWRLPSEGGSSGWRRWSDEERVCLLLAGLMSQQQASVSQGRICSDKFTRCHTETEAAD